MTNRKFSDNTTRVGRRWTQLFIAHCNARISGNWRETKDAVLCRLSSWLSVSHLMTSAANICLTRNAPQSRDSKIRIAIPSIAFCSVGFNELCLVQQASKWVIASGLLAHHRRYATSPCSKMHWAPEGSHIDLEKDHCQVTAHIQYKQNELVFLKYMFSSC